MRLKRATLAVITAAAVFCFSACSSSIYSSAGDNLSQSELSLLQGRWVPVEAELGGNPFPDEARKSIKMEISNDVYLVTVDNIPDKGFIKLNVEANPKRMEITGGEGPNKGRIIPAIYEIKGNFVNICYDLSGKGYPADFKTAKGAQFFLVKYAKLKD